MTHLPQLSLWIVAYVLVALFAYWRGSRPSRGEPRRIEPGTLERSSLELRVASLLDERHLLWNEINALHHRISWIRREQYIASAQPAVGPSSTQLATLEAAQ